MSSMKPEPVGPGPISSGGTTVALPIKIQVNWDLPPGTPDPDFFEIVGYTGTDPTDTTSWSFSPFATSDGKMRTQMLSLTPSANITGMVIGVYSNYNTPNGQAYRA